MKNGINIILYPRVYNLRGTSHSVLGLTSTGKIVNVKLRVDEKYQDQEFIPSIKEFASIERKAKMPCLATDNNGPQSREGLLLFSQCQPDGVNSNGIETYIAKWAVVLCEDCDSPEPIYGIGRLHINRFTKKTMAIKKHLKSLDDMNSQEGVSLRKALSNPENYSYPSVIYHPDHMLSFESDFDSDEFCLQVGKAVDQCCRSGMTGGFAIRALNSEGDIIGSSYIEKFQKYDSIMECFESGELTAGNYLASESYLSLMGEDYSQLDVIPITRIQSLAMTNAYYARKTQYARVSRMFEHELGNPKVCSVVIRPTYYTDEDRTLTSRIYTLSSPLGHPMRITRDGRLGLQVEGEAKIVTERMIEGARELHEIGLTTNPERLTRNYWVLGNQCANVIEESAISFSIKETSDQKDNYKLVEDTVDEREGIESTEIDLSTTEKPEEHPAQPKIKTETQVLEEANSELLSKAEEQSDSEESIESLSEPNQDDDDIYEEVLNSESLEAGQKKEEPKELPDPYGDEPYEPDESIAPNQDEQPEVDLMLDFEPEENTVEPNILMNLDFGSNSEKDSAHEKDSIEMDADDDSGEDESENEATGLAAFFNL
ncbi:hypothetical protein [Vibrio harveyi]|uniref:hypothetical protein n=1 Tax=Vibrio harveyi TaxID=669 RepID=UPI003CF38201